MEKKRVLVVDDQKNVGLILQEILEDLGLSVDVATSGNQGISMYSDAHNTENSYDLVLLDFHMPDINGDKVLEALKKINPAVKAILHSAAYFGNCQALGFVGKLEKPSAIKTIQQVTLSHLKS